MLTAGSLRHPVIRAKIVCSMLEAAALTSGNRRGRVYVKPSRAHGNYVMRVDAQAQAATSYLPFGVVFDFYMGNRLLNNEVAESLGYDTLNFVGILADRLAAPAVEKIWS